MKKKILITGSVGFVMSNFIRKLIYEKLPYNVVSIDQVSTNSLNSIYWNKNHTFHIADIRDQHIIDTIFRIEKPDIVIHGAAASHVDNSIKDPNEFITSNVLGTQILLNVSIKYEIEKFIYISTDKVYGNLLHENDKSWTEEEPLNPRNTYSASKASGELLVKAANQTHGLKYNITRSSNNYGPRQTPEKLIPKVIKCILNNEKIPIYGQGTQIRDWTHVFDNCSALLKIIESGKDNEIYNISSNCELSNLELVQKICNIMDNSHNLISFCEDRKGHNFRYSVDSTKLRNLGWKPKVKFKDGLNVCTNWYLDNRWMLK